MAAICTCSLYSDWFQPTSERIKPCGSTKIFREYFDMLFIVLYMYRSVSVLAWSYHLSRFCSFGWVRLSQKTRMKYDFGKINQLFCTFILTPNVLQHRHIFESNGKSFFWRILCKKKYEHISNTVRDKTWYIHVPHHFEGSAWRRFVTLNAIASLSGLLHVSDVIWFVFNDEAIPSLTSLAA